MRTSLQKIAPVAGIVIAMSIAACDDQGKNAISPIETYENAGENLADLKQGVKWRDDFVGKTAPVPLNIDDDMAKALPGIDEYTLTVNPAVSGDDVVVEIFVTTRRAWSPIIEGRQRPSQGLMAEVAHELNEQDQKVSDGRRAQVRVRSIPSGAGYQYIASKKYVPDACSPVRGRFERG